MIIPIWGSLTSGGSISAAAFAVSASFLAIGGGVAHENKGRTPTIIRIAGGASVVAAAVPAIALGYEIFALRRNVPLGAISHHKPSRAHYGGYTYTRTTGSGTGTTRGGHGAMCAMAVCAAAGVVGAGLVGSGAGQDNSEAPGTPQDDSSSNEYDTDNSIDEETGGAGWSICPCAFLHYLMVVFCSIFRQSKPFLRRRAKRGRRFRHGPGRGGCVDSCRRFYLFSYALFR